MGRTGLIVAIIVLVGMLAVSEAGWCQCTTRGAFGHDADNSKSTLCCEKQGHSMTRGANLLSWWCDVGPSGAGTFKACCKKQNRGVTSECQ